MVAPTRVLAQQIFGVVNDLTVGTGLRSKLVIGADGVGVEDETIKIGQVSENLKFYLYELLF